MNAGRGYPIVPEIGTEPLSDRDLLGRFGPEATARPSHDRPSHGQPSHARPSRDERTGEHRLIGDEPTDLAPPAPGRMAPAPPLGRQKPSRQIPWIWIGAVVVVAVVALAGVYYFKLGGQDPALSDVGATTEVIRLADQPASLWNVVGVGEVLNVRETPGLAGQLVTTLPPSAQGITSTGRRASADGLEWTEIVLDSDDASGWVAAQYLTADDANVVSAGG